MENKNPKMVLILDGSRPIFKCRVCERIWYPSIKPDSGGSLNRSAWQCPNGCELKDLKEEG
ncbi:hypothetical protein ES705_08074 [subsurface metagenome]